MRVYGGILHVFMLMLIFLTNQITGTLIFEPSLFHIGQTTLVPIILIQFKRKVSYTSKNCQAHSGRNYIVGQSSIVVVVYLSPWIDYRMHVCSSLLQCTVAEYHVSCNERINKVSSLYIKHLNVCLNECSIVSSYDKTNKQDRTALDGSGSCGQCRVCSPFVQTLMAGCVEEGSPKLLQWGTAAGPYVRGTLCPCIYSIQNKLCDLVSFSVDLVSVDLVPFCYEILPRIIEQLFTILLIQNLDYNISFTNCWQQLKTGYHLICLICEPKIEERQARRGYHRQSIVLLATWKVIESMYHLDKLKTISGDIKSQIYGYDDIRIVSPPIISKNVSAIHLNVHAAVVPIPSIAIQHIII